MTGNKKIESLKNTILEMQSLALRDLNEIEAGKLIWDGYLKKERKMTKEEKIGKANREGGALEMCKVLLHEIDILNSKK